MIENSESVSRARGPAKKPGSARPCGR